jgi:hypothetical protein
MLGKGGSKSLSPSGQYSLGHQHFFRKHDSQRFFNFSVKHSWFPRESNRMHRSPHSAISPISPGMNAHNVIAAWVTELRKIIRDSKNLGGLLWRFTIAASSRAFQASWIVACLSALGAIGMDSKSVKQEKPSEETTEQSSVHAVSSEDMHCIMYFSGQPPYRETWISMYMKRINRERNDEAIRK